MKNIDRQNNESNKPADQKSGLRSLAATAVVAANLLAPLPVATFSDLPHPPELPSSDQSLISGTRKKATRF